MVWLFIMHYDLFILHRSAVFLFACDKIFFSVHKYCVHSLFLINLIDTHSFQKGIHLHYEQVFSTITSIFYFYEFFYTKVASTKKWYPLKIWSSRQFKNSVFYGKVSYSNFEIVWMLAWSEHMFLSTNIY